MGGVGRQRHLEPGQRLVGAGDPDITVLDLDIGFVCFEKMGCNFFRLGFNLVQRLDDGRHADRAGTRTIGAHAHLHLVGVAMDDRDAVDRNAETLGSELGEGRLVALSVRMGASQDLDRADRIDPDLGAFPQSDAGAERADSGGRCNAAGFDVAA